MDGRAVDDDQNTQPSPNVKIPHFVFRETLQQILIILFWSLDISTNVWISYYFSQIEGGESYFIASLSLLLFGHLIIAFVGYHLISTDFTHPSKKILAAILCLFFGSILPPVGSLGTHISPAHIPHPRPAPPHTVHCTVHRLANMRGRPLIHIKHRLPW